MPAKFKGAFGCYAERFSPIGFHPGLDKNGSMKKDPLKLGPGQYDTNYKFCPYKNRPRMSIWQRQFDCEEFSKNLGYSHPELLREREYYAHHLGPGSHDVPVDYYKKTSSSTNDVTGFGSCDKRFRTFIDTDIPGPGTYLPKRVEHYFNKSGTNFIRSLRFPGKSPPWALPPNVYKLEGAPGSIQYLTNKVVSTRGPYDLFTGPREPSNCFNKFRPAQKCSPDKFYDTGTDLERLLTHKLEARRGKFLRAKRFPRKPSLRMMLTDLSLCYRDPDQPGPAHYDYKGDSIKALPPSMYPFDMSVKIAKPGIQWLLSPGTGRYSIKPNKCPLKRGQPQTSVFLSKTGRPEYKEQTYNNF